MRTSTDSHSAVLLLRVSSKEQGSSGLGIERQRADLQHFCQHHALKIEAEYEEIISGKYRYLSDRPVLLRAITKAAETNSIILVATISRLSRDVQLISTLINEQRVRFVTAETGLDATQFEIYLRAVFSQEERMKISKRTKGALAAAKKRGVILGGPNINEVSASGRATQKTQAIAYANKIAPMLKTLRDQGMSFEAIAKTFNDSGVSTRRGGQWYGTTVRRYFKKLAPA